MISHSKSKTLSYSKVGCFLACRRMFFLRYVEDLIPLSTPEVMSEGSLFHAVVAAIFKAMTESVSSKESVMAAAQEVINNMSAEYGLDQYSVVRVMESVQAFCSSYVFGRLAVSETEKHLKCTLRRGNKAVRIHGYLDAIGTLSMVDGIDTPVIIELKRKKQMSESVTAHTAFDYQPPFYTVLAEQNGMGRMAVLYLMVAACGLSPKKATPMEQRKYKTNGEPYAWVVLEDETVEEYRVRVHEWHLAKQGADVLTHVDKRNKDQTKAFVDDMLQVAQDMSTCKRNRYYYRNPRTCAIVPCQYASVCLEDTPELRTLNFTHYDGARCTVSVEEENIEI